MPLHLIAGPPLDVWTDNDLTENWLLESLLNERGSETDDLKSPDPWWLRLSRQSDRGILLKVEDENVNSAKNANQITEILIYAVVSKPLAQCTNLPTPPASSSPGPSEDVVTHETSRRVLDIKFKAFPLSFKHYSDAELARTSSPLSADSCLNQGKAQFLSLDQDINDDISTSPQKRQKISTMFEDATYQRKRFMRHGGERVSKAMAGVGCAVSNYEFSQSLQSVEIEDFRDEEQEKDTTRGEQRSKIMRASSTSSMRSTKSSQPLSRREAFPSSKRSSLHHMESKMSAPDDALTRDDINNIEQQNKASLARIVLAGMRIYGLQQRKKSCKSPTELEKAKNAIADDSDRLTEEVEEYKLVYHQTFKAASFTFRAHICKNIVSQEIMRDVVDRHLAIFCSDPLEASKINDSIDERFCGNRISAPNALDFPNGADASADGDKLCFKPAIAKTDGRSFNEGIMMS